MTIGIDAMYANEYDSFPIKYGEPITRGNVIFVDSDGKAYLACAAAGEAQKTPAIAVAETSSNPAISEYIEAKHSGKVYQTGLVPGLIYLSDTPGRISQTPGTHVQVLGYAVSPNEWIIHPDFIVDDDQLTAYVKPDSGIPESDLAQALQDLIDGAAVAADLAATTTGKGAALIGFETITHLTATTDLQAALAEIVGRIYALENP